MVAVSVDKWAMTKVRGRLDRSSLCIGRHQMITSIQSSLVTFNGNTLLRPHGSKRCHRNPSVEVNELRPGAPGGQ